MKTVYKYELAITDIQFIQMPIGAKIISVQNQNEDLCLWAIVDTEEIKEVVTFSIHGTGQEIRSINPPEYIGTCLMSNGLIWHVFKEVL